MLFSLAAIALFLACAWLNGRDRIWALAPLLLVSCTVIGWVEDHAVDAGGQVAEWIACPTDLVDCGEVLACEQPADNPLGRVEICVDVDDHPEDWDAVEALYGACEPTPRHVGLCLFCCGPDCGRGGNAFSGTFCEGH